MGYQLSLNAQKVVERLSRNPGELFTRPFAGYMFFLFDYLGANDLRVRDWLVRHADALDAMTGESVGFAVFTASLDFGEAKGTFPDYNKDHRSDPLPESDPSQAGVEGQPTSRRLDDRMIEELNHPTAQKGINSAIYDLAKSLGVLGKMPCLVVMDGLPCSANQHWKAFPLDEQILERLHDTMRKAVAGFEEHPHFRNYSSLLLRIHEAAKAISGLQWKTSKAEKDSKDSRHGLRAAIKEGDRRKFLSVLEPFGAKIALTSELQDWLFSEQMPRFSLAQAFIREIGDWQEWHWPLSAKRVEELVLATDEMSSIISGVRSCGDHPEACQSAEGWEGWILGFLANWAEQAGGVFEKLAISMGDDAMGLVAKGIRLWDMEKDLQRRTAEFNALYNEVAAMANRPSWVATLGTLFGEVDASQTSALSHLADWLSLGSPSLPGAISGGSTYNLQHLIAELVASHGTESLNRKPSVFVSYSSEDKAKVIVSLNAISATQPNLEIFRDEDSLRAGTEWKSELAEAIRTRDLFYLFWSEYSKASVNVQWEWEQAIEHRKRIVPISLVKPIPDPPKELGHIHFGNPYLPLLSNQGN